MKKPLRAWRTDIDPDLADAYAAQLERLGQTQRAGTERLMRAFLAMERDTQVMMLDLLTPERTGILARAMLRDMARKK